MITDFATLSSTLLQTFAFIVLYFFICFGPGFIVGILIANAMFGRGKPTLMESHHEGIKQATQHNAQWDPSNPRWRE